MIPALLSVLLAAASIGARCASQTWVAASAGQVNCTPSVPSDQPAAAAQAVVRATFAGLLRLMDPVTVARLRGKDLASLARASA